MEKLFPEKITLDKTKAVILDMDGVLVDTEPVHIESFKVLLSDLRLEYDDAFLNSFVGHSVEDNIRQIFEKIGKAVPEVISAEMLRREAIYLDQLQKTDLRAVQGIPELIGLCKKNKLLLALATSSIHEQVDVILEKLSGDGDGQVRELKTMLKVIVSGDQVKHKKPAADIYEQVVHKLKLQPGQCAAVEDSPSGIRSARAAGVYCIALRNRYWNREQLQEAQADWIVDSIADLVSALSDKQ